MKAAVCKKYGPPEVLILKEIPKPEPEKDEVCIKIKATAVNSADIRIRKFDVPVSFWIPARLSLGVFRPKYNILGNVIAGEIESVGSKVKRFKPGDKVFAASGLDRWGAYAEYICLKANSTLAFKPEKLNFEEAASIIFGGLTAIAFFQRGGIKKGQKILIYGASGSVGTAAVQLAKYLGAEVTGVCSGSNIELIRSIGADHVVDYQTEDFSRKKGYYDVLFDAVGKASLASGISTLKKGGIYLNAVDTPGTVMRMRWASLTKGIRLGAEGYDKSKHDNIRLQDFKQLKALADKNVFKPIIDRIYPLKEIVAAHRYVEKGHKKGNVIIRMNESA